MDLRADGQLVITDQGRGMSPEQIGQIGAFQQFDRKRYEQQGLGLGLYISSEIAKAHAGGIDASSNDEETRFTFRIPLA